MAIDRHQLRTLARARLAEAEALHAAQRHDGAAYLAGYTVELALKARICRTLKWTTFPETTGEFQGLASLRSHDLELLLRLSGREARIKAACLPQWTVMVTWRPEHRYRPIGTATAGSTRTMLDAARVLLRTLA